MSFKHSYILGSQSPRRAALLAALDVDFEIFPAGIDETALEPAPVRAFVMKAAVAKAEAVRSLLPRSDDPRPVITADTMVILDGELLGKPRDRIHAREMLLALSGRTHQVLTGLALGLSPGNIWVDAESSEVTFGPISPSTIDRYLESGGADDKAGGYGIQELGAFIERVHGDLSNVIGLPLECLRRGMVEAVGDEQLTGRSLREAVFRAYPDLRALPSRLWAGVPD